MNNSFSPGQQVDFTLEIFNNSGYDCYIYPDNHTPGYTITNNLGVAVYCRDPCGTSSSGSGAAILLSAGHGWGYTYSWDQRSGCANGCPQGQAVPAGNYTLTGAWAPATNNGQAFTIT